MKINLDDEEIERVIKALEHYAAYLLPVQRDESAYQRLADQLQKLLKRP